MNSLNLCRKDPILQVLKTTENQQQNIWQKVSSALLPDTLLEIFAEGLF